MTRARKIAIVGARSVGKSAVAVRYVDNVFVELYYPTIENQFFKSMVYGGQNYCIEILDTSGQDSFSMMEESCLVGVHGHMLVYSVTSRQSFEVVEAIREKILTTLGENYLMVLVGNKVDLTQQRQVAAWEGQALATKFGCKFHETSTKENANVDQAFNNLVGEMERDDNPQVKSQRCIIT